jgi:hypothetical protein
MATGGKWPTTGVWKTKSGTFVPLTPADVEALATQVAAYVAQSYAVEASYAAQIQINPSVDISTGWPSQG